MIGFARFNIKCFPFYSQSVFMYRMTFTVWDTLWPSWLRHCATNQKVTGLFPVGVIGVLYWLSHPGRSMVPGVRKRNECQGYILGGKGIRCVGLTTLPPSCSDCLERQRSGARGFCPDDLFPIQHSPIHLSKGSTQFSLLGSNWIFKYNVD
jgi:hypothetical protein